MARGILLDSSVWICYLRPHGWEEIKATVRQAFVAEQVYTCWVVKAEILIGARDEPGFAQLSETLRVLPEIPVTDRVWEAAARLGYTSRRQGVTVPLPDLVIAQAAITGDLVLWHVDDHFEHLRRHSPLQTRSFLSESHAGDA
jgi:predicted nucleic acid-binding protein